MPSRRAPARSRLLTASTRHSASTRPRTRAPVASDGGSELIVAGDDGEVLEEGESESDDGDTCACDELPEGVPCWPCYQDGATFDD